MSETRPAWYWAIHGYFKDDPRMRRVQVAYWIEDADVACLRLWTLNADKHAVLYRNEQLPIVEAFDTMVRDVRRVLDEWFPGEPG